MNKWGLLNMALRISRSSFMPFSLQFCRSFSLPSSDSGAFAPPPIVSSRRVVVTGISSSLITYSLYLSTSVSNMMKAFSAYALFLYFKNSPNSHRNLLLEVVI